MSPTARAQRHRANVATRRRRKGHRDPVLRALILTDVFGRRWTQVVDEHSRYGLSGGHIR